MQSSNVDQASRQYQVPGDSAQDAINDFGTKIGDLLQQLIDAEITNEGYGSKGFWAKLGEQFLEGVIGSAAMGATMGLVGGAISKAWGKGVDALAMPKAPRMKGVGLEGMTGDAEALHRSQMFSDQRIQSKLDAIQADPRLYDYNMNSINNWLSRDVQNASAFNEVHGKQMFGDQFIETPKLISDWTDTPQYQRFAPVADPADRVAQIAELKSTDIERPLQRDIYRTLLNNPSKDFRLLNGQRGTYYEKQLEKYGKWMPDGKKFGEFIPDHHVGLYQHEFDSLLTRSADLVGPEMDKLIAASKPGSKTLRDDVAEAFDAAKPETYDAANADTPAKLKDLISLQEVHNKLPSSIRDADINDLKKIAQDKKAPGTSFKKRSQARKELNYRAEFDKEFPKAQGLVRRLQPNQLDIMSKAGGRTSELAQAELEHRKQGRAILSNNNEKLYNELINQFNELPFGTPKGPSSAAHNDLVTQLRRLDPEASIVSDWQPFLKKNAMPAIDPALQDANLFDQGVANIRTNLLGGEPAPINYVNEVVDRQRPMIEMQPIRPAIEPQRVEPAIEPQRVEAAQPAQPVLPPKIKPIKPPNAEIPIAYPQIEKRIEPPTVLIRGPENDFSTLEAQKVQKQLTK